MTSRSPSISGDDDESENNQHDSDERRSDDDDDDNIASEQTVNVVALKTPLIPTDQYQPDTETPSIMSPELSTPSSPLTTAHVALIAPLLSATDTPLNDAHADKSGVATSLRLPLLASANLPHIYTPSVADIHPAVHPHLPTELAEPLLYDTDADVTDDRQTLAGRQRPTNLSATTPLLAARNFSGEHADRIHGVSPPPPPLKQPLLSPASMTRDVSSTLRRGSSVPTDVATSSSRYDAEFMKQAAVLQ